MFVFFLSASVITLLWKVASRKVFSFSKLDWCPLGRCSPVINCLRDPVPSSRDETEEEIKQSFYPSIFTIFTTGIWKLVSTEMWRIFILFLAGRLSRKVGKKWSSLRKDCQRQVLVKGGLGPVSLCFSFAKTVCFGLSHVWMSRVRSFGGWGSKFCSVVFSDRLHFIWKELTSACLEEICDSTLKIH